MTARLDHPNIVRVHEAGQEGPIHFLVTEFCDGPTLHQWLESQNGLISPQVAATIVRDLADAVNYAHSKSVVHRDIKPSNVLVVGKRDVDGFEAPIVKLCDFGLAKMLDEEVGHTRTGDLLGTPAYMAPEQAEGNVSKVDIRADVYSLGAVLFELLTGRAPFEGETRSAILLKVVNDEPANIRSLRKDVPLDLAVITAKCLSKSQQERYSTAGELSDELDRFLCGVPIHARPASWIERLMKWVRRRPAQAAAAALGILLPMTVLVISLWTNSLLLEKNEQIVRRLYNSDLDRSSNALQTGQLVEVGRILSKHVPKSGEKDRRTWGWYYLAKQIEGAEFVEWKCHDIDIYSVAVSSDGKRFLTGSRDGTACLWELETGRLIHRFSGHMKDINVVIFSPDNQQIATASEDGTCRLWDVATGECQHVLKGHTAEVGALAYSPDGKRLFSGSSDKTVRTWDVLSGAPIGVPLERDGKVDSLVVSSDGNSIITSDNVGGLIRWNMESSEIVRKVSSDEFLRSQCSCLALVSGDQDYILAGCGIGNRIVGFRITNGFECLRITLDSGARSFAVDAGRHQIVVAEEDGSVDRWNLLTHEMDSHIFQSRRRVWSTAIVPGADKVITASSDGIIRVHPWGSSKETMTAVRTFASLGKPVRHLRLTSDKSIAYAGGGDKLLAMDPTSGEIKRSKSGFSDEIWCIDLSPNERWLAIGDRLGRAVQVLDASTFETVSSVTVPHSGLSVQDVDFLPDNSSIVYGLVHPSRIYVWDFLNQKIIWQNENLGNFGANEIFDIECDANGEILASSDSKQILRLQKSDSGYIENCRANINMRCSRLCIEPEGTVLASTREGEIIRLNGDSLGFNARTRQTSREVLGIAISDDGKYILACDRSGRVILDDRRTFFPKRAINLVGEHPEDCVFLKGNGNALVSMNNGDIVQVDLSPKKSSFLVRSFVSSSNREIIAVVNDFDGSIGVELISARNWQSIENWPSRKWRTTRLFT